MAGSVVRSQAGLPVTKEEEAAAVDAVRDMLGPDQQVDAFCTGFQLHPHSCQRW